MLHVIKETYMNFWLCKNLHWVIPDWLYDVPTSLEEHNKVVWQRAISNDFRELIYLCILGL